MTFAGNKWMYCVQPCVAVCVVRRSSGFVGSVGSVIVIAFLTFSYFCKAITLRDGLMCSVTVTVWFHSVLFWIIYSQNREIQLDDEVEVSWWTEMLKNRLNKTEVTNDSTDQNLNIYNMFTLYVSINGKFQIKPRNCLII